MLVDHQLEATPLEDTLKSEVDRKLVGITLPIRLNFLRKLYDERFDTPPPLGDATKREFVGVPGILGVRESRMLQARECFQHFLRNIGHDTTSRLGMVIWTRGNRVGSSPVA